MEATEKVPMFIVYKDKQQIKAEMTPDTNHYKLYGFLKTYITLLEQQLINNIQTKKEKKNG